MKQPVIEYFTYIGRATYDSADYLHDNGFFMGNDVIDLKENIDMVYDEFVKIENDFKTNKLKQDMLNENLGLKGDGSLDCDIVGIKGHGVVSIAETPWEAFEHIERLEHICKIVLVGGV